MYLQGDLITSDDINRKIHVVSSTKAVPIEFDTFTFLTLHRGSKREVGIFPFLPVCLKVTICQKYFPKKTLKVVGPWYPPSAPTLPETH